MALNAKEFGSIRYDRLKEALGDFIKIINIGGNKEGCSKKLYDILSIEENAEKIKEEKYRSYLFNFYNNLVKLNLEFKKDVPSLKEIKRIISEIKRIEAEVRPYEFNKNELYNELAKAVTSINDDVVKLAKKLQSIELKIIKQASKFLGDKADSLKGKEINPKEMTVLDKFYKKCGSRFPRLKKYLKTCKSTIKAKNLKELTNGLKNSLSNLKELLDENKELPQNILDNATTLFDTLLEEQMELLDDRAKALGLNDAVISKTQVKEAVNELAKSLFDRELEEITNRLQSSETVIPDISKIFPDDYASQRQIVIYTPPLLEQIAEKIKSEAETANKKLEAQYLKDFFNRAPRTLFSKVARQYAVFAEAEKILEMAKDVKAEAEKKARLVAQEKQAKSQILEPVVVEVPQAQVASEKARLEKEASKAARNLQLKQMDKNLKEALNELYKLSKLDVLTSDIKADLKMETFKTTIDSLFSNPESTEEFANKVATLANDMSKHVHSKSLENKNIILKTLKTVLHKIKMFFATLFKDQNATALYKAKYANKTMHSIVTEKDAEKLEKAKLRAKASPAA